MPTVYNKVTAGGQTLIDLSQDTVTSAAHIVSGHTGHLADGTQVAGTGGGGGGLVYETGTWTPITDISKPTINFVNVHTNRPFFVMLSDTSETQQGANYMLEWFIASWYDAFSYGAKVGATQINYARTQAMYSTGTNFSVSNGNVSYLDGSTATTHMGYYLTNEMFSPYTGSASRYWKASQTYKWIAVWKPST